MNVFTDRGCRAVEVLSPALSLSIIVLSSLLLVAPAKGEKDIYGSGGQGDNLTHDVPELSARVKALRTYSAGATLIPVEERVYRNRYNEASTNYIWWEIELAYPEPGRESSISLKGVINGPGGRIIGETPMTGRIQAHWTGSWHTTGWGSSQRGTWSPGIYQVVVSINDREVAETSFMIERSLPDIPVDQRPESFMQQFQTTLMDSFIGHLAADGRSVTSRQRAMFMGYILNRQNSFIGTYDTDKIRMASLVAEVNGFLEAISPDEDYWPVVEAAMRGDHDREIDTLLGGSAYVAPIFPTLDGMVVFWRDQEYCPHRFASYPGSDDIRSIPLEFLRLLKERQLWQALQLTCGKQYDEISTTLLDAATTPELRDALHAHLDALEWKAGTPMMSQSDPPMVLIDYIVRDSDGDWQEVRCILILDRDVWRIARFL